MSTPTPYKKLSYEEYVSRCLFLGQYPAPRWMWQEANREFENLEKKA
jgi:hypothetical protein